MEPLPEGWTMITHTSGIPVYLHKKSKVVTWSRPYCLLSGHILVRLLNFENTIQFELRMRMTATYEDVA